jgi:hypothetical protein
VSTRGLRKAGKCFVLGAFKDSRYFASAERTEACRPAWDAFMAQVKIQRRNRMLERERIQERAYYARLKAAGKLPKRERKPRPPKPKVPKLATPKKPKAAKSVNAGGLIVRQPALNAGVEIKKPREVLPVVIPSHVRVQVCPCGKDQRYSVPADHVGEFLREWRALPSPSHCPRSRTERGDTAGIARGGGLPEGNHPSLAGVSHVGGDVALRPVRLARDAVRARERHGKPKQGKVCDSRTFALCIAHGASAGCHFAFDNYVDISREEARELGARLSAQMRERAIAAGWRFTDTEIVKP